MAIEMSKYLGIYVTEASEHLEALGRELVELEKNADDSLVDSMFRHAHSVKGMAAAMGYEASAILAHRLEDIVQLVRSDRSKLSGDLVDLLLAATDALMEQVRAAGENREAPQTNEILGRVTGTVSALTGRAPAPTRVLETAPPARQEHKSPPANAPAVASNFHGRWAIQLRVAASCQVPGVRAFLVYKRLCNAGQIFELRPPIESLRSGRIPDGLISLKLETSAPSREIESLVKNIAEVELLSLQPANSAPAEPASTQEASAASRKSGGTQEAHRTVRIRTELLDYFLENAGELLLASANLREWGKGLPAQIRAQ